MRCCTELCRRGGHAKRFCAASVAFCALLVAGCSRSSGSGEKPALVVISGDTAGWIVPCGCTSNQSGGLPRRGSYINGLRKNADVILADVGGVPAGDSEYQRLKFEALLKGTKPMGLAAQNIGAGEARLGAAYLRDVGRDYELPFVSANVRDEAGLFIAAPLRVATVGKQRVALAGVLSPKLAPPGVRVDDPREAVLAALAQNQQKYDVLIVLAYLPEAELRDLAGKLPEADAIVGGPTGQNMPAVQVGPTLLTSATNEGKFLVQLELPGTAEGAKKDSSGNGRMTAEFVELSEKFPDDPDQKRNIDAYLAELDKRDFSADKSGFAPRLPASVPTGYRVAGSDSCRPCHEAEWDKWRHVHHSAAWQSLKDRGYQVDPYCQQCHTTAYGQPGGFVSIGSSPDRLSVGCESCHGPSQGHVEEPKVHTPFTPADQCARCHDRENSPKFDFDTYWPKIQHGPRATAATTSDAATAPADSSPRGVSATQPQGVQ